LKTELVHPCRFPTRQQAIEQIADYIELFYNRQRFQARAIALCRGLTSGLLPG
jgi:putative transposase